MISEIDESEIERTQQAFDAAAPVYDAEYEGLPLFRAIGDHYSIILRRKP
jgi:hypothetical protein